MLETQIENREKVIENIQQSIKLFKGRIDEEIRNNRTLDEEYQRISEDYNSLLRLSYVKLLSQNRLVYLFSAEDWEQSLQRLGFSRSLEHYLGQQVRSLEQKRRDIQTSIDKISAQQQEEEALLAQEKEIYERLEQDKDRKDQLLYRLQGDEMRLKGALIQQRREREELNQAIEDVRRQLESLSTQN